jgi:hypothetical protein
MVTDGTWRGADVTQPEEDQEKSKKTDDVLYSADGDPHHNLAQAPQPDEHLPARFQHDGETETVGDE